MENKTQKYNIKLVTGEICESFSRYEVLGLIGINEDYNKALVQDIDNLENWIPIIDWANNSYELMHKTNHYYFQGEPLSWWESLMALAFLYPKSWRLLSFELKEGNYILKFGDGRTVSFSSNNFEAEINIDKSFRRKITIKIPNEKKCSFFESMMGYADSDFDLMVQLLEAKESKLMKFTVELDKINRALRRSITHKYNEK